MERLIMRQFKQVKIDDIIQGCLIGPINEVKFLIAVSDARYVVQMNIPSNYPMGMPTACILNINNKYAIGESICLGQVHKDTLLEYVQLFIAAELDAPDKYNYEKNIIENNITNLIEEYFT
jgi:hypothetical protein